MSAMRTWPSPIRSQGTSPPAMTRQLAGGEMVTLQGVAAGSRTGDQSSSGIGETGNHRNGWAMAILVASLTTLLSTQTTHSHHHRGGVMVAGVVTTTSGENQDGDRTGTTVAVLGMGTVGVTDVG